MNGSGTTGTSTKGDININRSLDKKDPEDENEINLENILESSKVKSNN